jgi:two-component SAPR family response regulator
MTALRTEPQKTLEIFTLGTFVLKNNLTSAPINKITEQPNKAWELFKFLLTNRDKLLIPEKIIETLWPKVEYTNPGASFRYHVYKMRQLLKKASIPEKIISIVSSNGYYSLETGPGCWLDAEEFINLSRKADELSQSSPAEAINLYIDALSLYKGEYLPEVAGNWVFLARYFYRSLYLKNIFKVSKLLKRSGRFDRIIEIIETAFFLIESVEEELHLLYMNTLLEVGKVERARAHYELLTTTMYQEAGVKPSKALRKVYQKIKNNYEASISDLSDLTEFTDVQEIREKREKVKGALICDPDIFRFLCKLERRRSERSSNSIYLGILSIDGSNGRALSSAELQVALKSLKTLLLNNLRKGDIISQWDKNQFILLLAEMDQEQANRILGRIKGKFKKKHFKGEDVLHCTVHSLSSGG